MSDQQYPVSTEGNMARYGKKSQQKVAEKMREFKHGKLKSGSGQKVKNRKQAVAIGLSEARKEGDKVPPSPDRSPDRGSGKE
jgi:hypothetical protein